MTLGYQSDVGAIKSLMIKHPRDAFVNDEHIASQWERLNYRAPPDFARAVDEYDRFVALLRGLGIDPHFLPADAEVGLDSLYTRDASIVCDRGVILCSMGKPERRNEPKAQEAVSRAMGVPVCGAITGDGRLEGGDFVWLDGRTAAIGWGYRSNDEGIRQLRKLLGDCVDELIVVPLPHWHGPNDVFHLMSIISPIDHDLALVYSPLLPVPFREALFDRGIKLIEVPSLI